MLSFDSIVCPWCIIFQLICQYFTYPSEMLHQSNRYKCYKNIRVKNNRHSKVFGISLNIKCGVVYKMRCFIEKRCEKKSRGTKRCDKASFNLFVGFTIKSKIRVHIFGFEFPVVPKLFFSIEKLLPAGIAM